MTSIYNKYDRGLMILTKIPYKSNAVTEKWAKNTEVIQKINIYLH